MLLLLVRSFKLKSSDFEIVTTTTGAISIRNIKVNEIMHNPVGPWVEANSLYINQSRLKERLLETTSEPLIIFDVGLGAATNAIAAMTCARKRPLRIVSFERDLNLLKFALLHAEKFDYFSGYEPAISDILAHGRSQSSDLLWEVRHGDFLETISNEIQRPHLIFFDPYSPRVNNDMWTMACFKKIRKKCREEHEGGTSLFTYSLATRIRVALIAAGFFVGYGKPTGEKTQTTEAATVRSMLNSPLDKMWFERWQRSDSRYPFDCNPENQAEVDKIVENYFLKELSS